MMMMRKRKEKEGSETRAAAMAPYGEVISFSVRVETAEGTGLVFGDRRKGRRGDGGPEMTGCSYPRELKPDEREGGGAKQRKMMNGSPACGEWLQSESKRTDPGTGQLRTSGQTEGRRSRD
ncbi:hypothetical protein KUCAC02_007033 [Chaenocephalus aceratus]|nr:hypothetical protein KUCAC02_007033 [Chaenocephalus aceratus]